jgi:hypothetical protein
MIQLKRGKNSTTSDLELDESRPKKCFSVKRKNGEALDLYHSGRGWKRMSLLAMMSCARGKIQQKNSKKQWKKCSLWSEEASSLMKSAHILSFFSTIFDNIHHSFRVSCTRVSKQRQERLVSCFFFGGREVKHQKKNATF